MVSIGCISCSSSKNLQTKNGMKICNNCLRSNKESFIIYEKQKTTLLPEINEIIYNKLYLGNYDTAKSKEILDKFKITHILICGKYMEKLCEDEYNYLQIDLEDIIEENIEKYFDISYNYINSGERVFVHCNAGISRSPSIVIAYLIRKKMVSFQEAYQMVKACRDSIFPNESFVEQLKAYGERIMKK